MTVSVIKILLTKIDKMNRFDKYFAVIADKTFWWVVCIKWIKKWYQEWIPDFKLVKIRVHSIEMRKMFIREMWFLIWSCQFEMYNRHTQEIVKLDI